MKTLDRYFLDTWELNHVAIRDGRTGKAVEWFRYYSTPGELAAATLERAQRACAAINAREREGATA